MSSFFCDLRTTAYIAKGKDISLDIQSIKKKRNMLSVRIRDKIYDYLEANVEILEDPKRIEVENILISVPEFSKAKHPTEVYEFKSLYGRFWHIMFNDNFWVVKKQDEIEVDDVLCDGKSRDVFRYLKKLASKSDIKGDDGECILEQEYERINSLRDTVLSLYLNPKKYRNINFSDAGMIYPFGCNASQMAAVEKALTNKLSIIQGPPGTGKTQTILNIISNILIRNKTVIIVSSNNSAIENVEEKLCSEECGLSFILARLGRVEKKDEFFASQTSVYPDMLQWKRKLKDAENIRDRIDALSERLKEHYKIKQRQVILKKEYSDFLIENRHYENFILEEGVNDIYTFTDTISSDDIYSAYNDIISFSEENKRTRYPLWFRIKTVLFKKVFSWKDLKKTNEKALISALEKECYKRRKTYYEDEISACEKKLNDVNFSLEQKKIKDLSDEYLKSILFIRYLGRRERQIFDKTEASRNPEQFLKEYPVVLSTCFTSHSSLRNAIYDYLIMDEASQVNLTEGALSLSVARNAVIVGDLKQLPNVVGNEEKAEYDRLFKESNLPAAFSYSDNSILSSILKVCSDVPQTLLREHYRCHPKIIGFCNEKFYDGQLLIMTEDKGEDDVLKLIKTPEGNFRRDNNNKRQREILYKEIINQNINTDDIAVISPYRQQVNMLRSESDLDSDTVHKYQGREKDTVAITLVDDIASDFTDNPNFLNVAISRAKNHLIVITSGNKQPEGSNINDLIEYARYNSFSVEESTVRSIFDMLYKCNENFRKTYLQRHKRISEFDSENLMGALISDILSTHKEYALDYIAHYPLRYVVNQNSVKDEDLRKYISKTWTHIDFLIYRKIGKKPVVAIEVDGYRYHKEGTIQSVRDNKKDKILSDAGIPVFRFKTDGSGEKEKLESFLKERFDRK